ncbi:hypothetical protein [Rhizobium sp.]|uniref:hypothetical protein n=1 Tax=Rhizobium sp. TaxID=391 RepID=UPI0028AFB2A1
MKISRRNLLIGITSPIAIFPFMYADMSLAASDVLGRERGHTWDLKSFPDMLATAFFQEDVAEGPVSAHRARGILPLVASQTVTALRPEKTSSSGIVFAGGRNSHLRFPNVKDSLKLYRWCLTITRVTTPGNARSFAQVVSVNDGTSAQNCHPKVALEGSQEGSRITVTWHGANGSKTVKASLKDENYIADEWNVSLTYRRHGRLFSSLNGVDCGYINDIVNWAWPTIEGGPESIIGGRRSPDLEWGYDCIVFGQGELTERMVQKIEGWAAWRAGCQAILPLDHPYRHSRPVVDDEDIGPAYKFDESTWLAWGDALRPKETSARLGKTAQRRSDFQRVFYDDFRSKSIASSSVASGSAPTWFAPGWNPAVGASAQLLPPNAKLKLYEPTTGANGDGREAMRLSLKYDKSWFAPAIYTVNDAGQGHSWEGEAIFRLRCRMGTYAKVPGGFFPAFWCYALEPLFVRHLERIEIDFWEFDGKNPRWLNGGSSHVHSANLSGLLGHLDKDAKRYKVWAGELTAARLGIENDFSPWDGKWHTWEFATDEKLTTLSVSVEKDGREEMVELYRCPTPKEYLERRYAIVNYALRLEDGEPDRSVSHDLDIDFFEVLQRTESLSAYAPPFHALPRIVGKPSAGQSLTCDHGLSNRLKDIWYYWYSDGYPRSVSPNSNFVVQAEDMGKAVRCMVKAVGALGQPEAWSNAIEITG